MKKQISTNQTKVLVALSGGVDSSVAAAKLIERGYNVTGAFMINYGGADGSDCWINDYRDALKVAARLKINLIKFDFTKEYKKEVLKYMYGQYEKGLTPNPDVMCNNKVKFGVWLKKARELGFDKLATGHYAKLEQDKKGVYHLIIPKDKDKDQTYFLHGLDQKQLSQVIFPLSDITKVQVRQCASKLRLTTATKEESMGICFIGEVKMKEFLENKIKTQPGRIVLNSTGEKIGEHQGLAFYTIGQRHIGEVNTSKIFKGKKTTEPLYVVKKDIKSNVLFIGFKNDPDLYTSSTTIKKPHWISGQPYKFPLQCKVRLRHRQKLCNCTVKSQDGDGLLVEFEKKQRAVTSGQFAVFYLNSECVGGGEIA